MKVHLPPVAIIYQRIKIIDARSVFWSPLLPKKGRRVCDVVYVHACVYARKSVSRMSWGCNPVGEVGGRWAESLFWTCLKLKMSTWFSSAVPVSQALTQTAGLTTGVFMHWRVRACVCACVLWSQTVSTAAGLSARSAHASGFRQDLATRDAFVVLPDPSRFNKTSATGGPR